MENMINAMGKEIPVAQDLYVTKLWNELMAESDKIEVIGDRGIKKEEELQLEPE